MGTPTGPLVPRTLLGRRLRELRDAAGYTRADAGKAVGASSSKIGRLERGGSGVDGELLLALLLLYGLDDETERARLLALAARTDVPGWWAGFHDVLPPWTHRYLGAEQSAQLVRTFDAQMVPTLLQTPGYARCIVRARHPRISERELDRRVEVRMRRRQILRRRPRPTNLWAVVDEAVLHRRVGERAVMVEQLEFLLKECQRPNITLQVVGFETGGLAAATSGPLTLVRFLDWGLPDLLYLERLDGAVYPSDRAEIERHWHVFNTLVTEAKRPEFTPNIIKRALHGM
ncbi:DUF5753 domain-containing protein [Actinomadura hibisca]|uniref:DUF5753 domain-containing protein n=1 Tax=Actinomadura hibisca TaxID=68565 RepID=UPI00082B2D7E|nr:DUF5753 domain-containing protein [Actinomadura hibisca]